MEKTNKSIVRYSALVKKLSLLLKLAIPLVIVLGILDLYHNGSAQDFAALFTLIAIILFIPESKMLKILSIICVLISFELTMITIFKVDFFSTESIFLAKLMGMLLVISIVVGSILALPIYFLIKR